MDEFGMGCVSLLSILTSTSFPDILVLTIDSSANVYSHFGPAKNPKSVDATERSAGGSSGGSAVAVASEMCKMYVHLSFSFPFSKLTSGRLKVPSLPIREDQLDCQRRIVAF